VLAWHMGVHTEPSKLAGLCSGGVPFLAVAKDGTLTSPRMSSPSALDFLRRGRRPSAPLVLSLPGAPLSGGNGSVIVKYNYKSNTCLCRGKEKWSHAA
jgi:hypothetical protein